MSRRGAKPDAFAILIFSVDQVLWWYDESSPRRAHLYCGVLRKIRLGDVEYPLHVQPLEASMTWFQQLIVGGAQGESAGLTPISPLEVLAARDVTVDAFLFYIEI